MSDSKYTVKHRGDNELLVYRDDECCTNMGYKVMPCCGMRGLYNLPYDSEYSEEEVRGIMDAVTALMRRSMHRGAVYLELTEYPGGEEEDEDSGEYYYRDHEVHHWHLFEWLKKQPGFKTGTPFLNENSGNIVTPCSFHLVDDISRGGSYV